MITELIILSATVTLIYDSGFFDYLDEWINKKKKFLHLPHIIMCKFCATWWCCIIYTLVKGEFSLMNTLFCIVCANLTEIYTAIVSTLKNLILKIIETIFNFIDRWE